MKIEDMSPENQRVFLLAERMQEDSKSYRQEYIDVDSMEEEDKQRLYDMIMDARKRLHMAHVELAPHINNSNKRVTQ